MPNNNPNSSQLYLNHFIEVAFFDNDKKKYLIKDFYPLIVDEPTTGEVGYTTKNSDFISFDIEEGIEEGIVEFKVPYSLEGQRGTVIGDWFVNRDLSKEYTLVSVLGELYSVVDMSFKYSENEKGVLVIRGFQINEWFDSVLVPPNVWRVFNRKDDNKTLKGYKGKIYYNKKSISVALQECFDRCLTSKKKINKPGSSLNVNDTAKMPIGFAKPIVSKSFDTICSFEVEPQGMQDIVHHLNNKYNLKIKITGYVKNGKINLEIKQAKKYNENYIKSFSNTEYTLYKNNDFLNSNITLTADSRFETTYQKERKFISLFLEKFDQLESYHVDDDSGPSEESSDTKRYAKIKFETLILEGISDFENYIQLKVGDTIGKRVIKGKKISMSKSELSFSIAFEEIEEINTGDIISDIPDIDNNINSEAVFLYHNLSSLVPNLEVGKRYSPGTKIGEESDGFFLQSQKSSITLEDFRRKSDNLDSVGGTHDPMADFGDVGSIDSPITLTYRTNDGIDFTDKYPNIGIRFSDSIVKTPLGANSEILQKGTDPEFGNYVLIKFK